MKRNQKNIDVGRIAKAAIVEEVVPTSRARLDSGLREVLGQDLANEVLYQAGVALGRKGTASSLEELPDFLRSSLGAKFKITGRSPDRVIVERTSMDDESIDGGHFERGVIAGALEAILGGRVEAGENPLGGANYRYEAKILNEEAEGGPSDDSPGGVNPAGRAKDSFLHLMGQTAQVLHLDGKIGAPLGKKTDDLRESEKFLQSVIDGIRDGIKIIDRNYRVLFANRSAQALIGSSQEGLVGGKCYREFYGLDAPCPFCVTPRTFETGELGHTSYHFMDEDGSEKFMELYTYPIADEGGKVDKVIEISRDVTEHKKLEDQVIRSEKLASVGELASGVAHEVRNPLTGIRLGIDALTLEPNIGGNESNLKIIAKILKDIDRLDKVVSQLLNFTKKRGLKLESADVNKVLGDALLFVEGQAESRGITFVKDYADDLKSITMDVNQMQQVFLNILLNAVQAMPAGGELQLSTRFVESWKDYKDDIERAGGLIVCRDSGSGIPEHNKDKIFDPFFSTKERGTGLGLSVSHKILEDHQGSIKVDSKEGVGTTVTIFLPSRR